MENSSGMWGHNTPLRRVVSGFQGAQDGVTEGAVGVQRGCRAESRTKGLSVKHPFPGGNCSPTMPSLTGNHVMEKTQNSFWGESEK